MHSSVSTVESIKRNTFEIPLVSEGTLTGVSLWLSFWNSLDPHSIQDPPTADKSGAMVHELKTSVSVDREDT